MSFNSKAYLAHEERRLEPGSVIRTGNRRRYQTSQAAKNQWLESMSPEDWERLRIEYEYEQSKLEYQW